MKLGCTWPPQESFGSVRTVRSFANEEYERLRYAEKVDDTLKLGLQQAVCPFHTVFALPSCIWRLLVMWGLAIKNMHCSASEGIALWGEKVYWIRKFNAWPFSNLPCLDVLGLLGVKDKDCPVWLVCCCVTVSDGLIYGSYICCRNFGYSCSSGLWCPPYYCWWNDYRHSHCFYSLQFNRFGSSLICTMSIKQLSCMALRCATWWLIFFEACNHVIWYDRSCLQGRWD